MSLYQLGFLLLTFLLISCASTVDTYGQNKKSDANINEASIKEDKATVVISAANRNVPRRIEAFNLRYYQSHYQLWVDYFTHKDKERFIRFLSNANKYKDIIEEVFREHNLPEELFYVGLIESGFYKSAKSHAGAAGPWQFMRGTGKQFGLRVDNMVDERLNIYKATHAAAAYFKDLYNIFGSWELALAGYNAGEYRIIRAIRKGGTRSFKELVKKNLLPKETIHYVPKVAAAMDVSKTLFKYAEKNTALKKLFTNTKEVKIRNSFNVDKLAKVLDVSKRDLLLLNNDIRSSYVKVDKRHLVLYVPSSKNPSIREISSVELPVEEFKPAPDKETIYHTVRKGQSLGFIAKKYKTSISKIKSMNKLKSNDIMIGQKLKVTSRDLVYHEVKKGENLTMIARKFEVPVWSIKKINSLKRDTLFVGQVLKIPTDSTVLVKN